MVDDWPSQGAPIVNLHRFGRCSLAVLGRLGFRAEGWSLAIRVLTGLLVAGYAGPAAAEDGTAEATFRDAIATVARVDGHSFQETCKEHQSQLTELFHQFVAARGGNITPQIVDQFHALVNQCGMTTFDDFRSAMVEPLKYITDPHSGDRVPVMGPLGSDIINPWLAAMGVQDGQPLDEQPMYKLAADVLREHIDFALIGVADPRLTWELLPAELLPNARWAYRRLNPTRRFDGGFDHPLFYATIREAAAKLFREDYPRAKLTMADIVLEGAQGGFGLRSCLLCHNRDHEGVYMRLLSQTLYHESQATGARQQRQLLADGPDQQASELNHQAEREQALAATFRLAAERVLDSHREKIDAEKVRAMLQTHSPQNLARLQPGFEEFYATLDAIGCTMCHTAGAEPAPKYDPARYGAFVLVDNNYFKAKNVQALSALIDPDDLAQSKLLSKAAGSVRHRGRDQLELDEEDLRQLRLALEQWLDALP